MSSFETSGAAMFQLHEANRALARGLADFLRTLFRRGYGEPFALSGATFTELEPGLEKEAHLPAEHIKSF